MNTRLLMELRVEVGGAQEIGAVLGGTRRTVPLAGGTFDGRLRGVLSPAVARTDCSFERTAYSNSLSAPRSGPTTAR